MLHVGVVQDDAAELLGVLLLLDVQLVLLVVLDVVLQVGDGLGLGELCI